MKRKILIYTDSRGQHIPYGADPFDLYAMRLSKRADIEADVVLCPMKWTTTVDFLDFIKERKPSQYDAVILHTGIVDWSPRPQASAWNDLYDNQNPAHLGNVLLNTREFSKKVINNKKASFDAIFGEEEMLWHLQSDFGVEYEGQPTINMYGQGMAEKSLLPRLAEIDNLIFINSNRFVPGWEGDYTRGRPANIALTERYSELFRDVLGPNKVIDLLQWDEADIKCFTCDNIHLTREGSDHVYDMICDRLEALSAPRSEHVALSAPRIEHDATPAPSFEHRGSKPGQTSHVDGLISVVVPVFNVQNFLRECLDTLVDQTDDFYEVVIVDDGSTDGSPSIIKEYVHKHPHFRSVRQENDGLGGARNTGVTIAAGEFVTFVDSDDYVSHDYVATLRQAQASGCHDVVSGGFNRVSEHGSVLPSRTINTQIVPEGLRLKPYQMLLGAFTPSVAWARLFRRSLFGDHDLLFPSKMPHEDLFFTYKSLFFAASSASVDKTIYYYRQRGSSLSKSATVSHADAAMLEWCDTTRFLNDISASEFDRDLAARRTLIFLEGISRRISASTNEVQQYFNEKVLHRLDDVESLMAKFESCSLNHTYSCNALRNFVLPLKEGPAPHVA